MRRFLTTMLIALLAMRVLVGDAMAYEMVQQMSAPAQAAETSAHTSAALPCHDAGLDDGAPAETVAGTCTTCQICHLSTFLPAAWQFPELALPHAQLAQHVSAWQNAEGALVRKPPIS